MKIPATRASLPGITEAIALSVDVNVTLIFLIFSVQRYREVMKAYLDAAAAGAELSGIDSVASCLVSRVGWQADRRLEKIGTDETLALRGLAGIANCRVTHPVLRDAFTGPRWERLMASGARVQRPLWAATSVKNPAYPDPMYVFEFVAPGAVNTLPEATLNAFRRPRRAAPSEERRCRHQSCTEAREALGAGVDLTEVFAVLERDGVDRFSRSWAGLHETVGRRMERDA